MRGRGVCSLTGARWMGGAAAVCPGTGASETSSYPVFSFLTSQHLSSWNPGFQVTSCACGTWGCTPISVLTGRQSVSWQGLLCSGVIWFRTQLCHFWLCDLRRLTPLLLASISSSVKWCSDRAWFHRAGNLVRSGVSLCSDPLGAWREWHNGQWEQLQAPGPWPRPSSYVLPLVAGKITVLASFRSWVSRKLWDQRSLFFWLVKGTWGTEREGEGSLLLGTLCSGAQEEE